MILLAILVFFVGFLMCLFLYRNGSLLIFNSKIITILIILCFGLTDISLIFTFIRNFV